MNKTIALIILGLFTINLIFAFDATRTISQNSVTINVDASGTNGFIITETLPAGIAASNVGQGGVYTPSANAIKWTKSGNSETIFTYSYSGTVSGPVSGTITGGDPASTKNILGQNQLNTNENPDANAPIISGVVATPSENSAFIEWATDKNSNSIVYYGLTPSLGSEKQESAETLRHFISLTGLTRSSTYYYKVKSCTSDGKCAESSLLNFATQGIQQAADDLMVNYVRGKLLLDGNPAPAGTSYLLEVLSGDNAGYNYIGKVDEGIPSSLKGNGYFDTKDNIKFSTGAKFKITFDGYTGCNKDGTFENGGNGEFNAGQGLVIINCRTDIDQIMPSVTLLNPANGISFNVPDVDFSFQVSDNEALQLTCGLYVDNLLKSSVNVNNGGTGNFLVRNIADGNYIWNVKCSDGYNDGQSASWEFGIDAPNAPVFLPIPDKTIFENQSLSFNVDASDADSDIVEYYAESLPMGAVFAGKIFSWTPTFEQSGTYSVRFFVRDAAGLIGEGIAKIIVKNVKIPPVFNDAKKCESKSGSIAINMQEPDDRDDFTIGKEILSRIKIKNNFEDEKEFKVIAYLYDLTEDESVEDSGDKVEIKSKKSGTVELELKIPADLDEEKEYAVYVYAKDEDGNCNSAYVEIEIERPEDAVEIKGFEIAPEVQEPGKSVEFLVEVENTGTDEQDVRIEIVNSQLGLNMKSEEFELEEFGEDDKETRIFSFKLPANAPDGDYEIKATAFFDEGKTSRTAVLGILAKEEVWKVYADGSITYLNGLPVLKIQDSRILSISDLQKAGKHLLVSDGVSGYTTAETKGRTIIVYDYGDVVKSSEKESRIIFDSTPSQISQKDYRGIFGGLVVGNLSDMQSPLLKTLFIILDIVLAVGSIVLFYLVIKK